MSTIHRSSEKLVEVDRLHKVVEGIFVAAGLSPDDAWQITDVLVWADVHGVPMLGVAKVPQYLARMRAGGTKQAPEAATVRDAGAAIVIDASDGWGHVIAPRAMRRAMERARDHGIGLAVVRNTTSSGALGYYAMQAARESYIGWAINNCPPLMAPAGGTGKVLGNQAFAIAAPAGRHKAILLDMAISGISQARIHEHLDAGTRLPEGVALSSTGRPTRDPREALSGSLLPMGSHRGSGLAIMWEVLTGVLAGGPRFGPNLTMPDDLARPQGISLFLMAIDTRLALPSDGFEQRVDRVVDYVHSTEPAPGIDRVRVPGERSFELADRRKDEGIPLPTALADTLRALAAELDVQW